MLPSKVFKSFMISVITTVYSSANCVHLFQTNGGDLPFNVAFIMDMNGDQHGHELQILEPLILIYFTGLSVKLLISLLKWILLFQKYQLPVTTLKTKSHRL